LQESSKEARLILPLDSSTIESRGEEESSILPGLFATEDDGGATRSCLTKDTLLHLAFPINPDKKEAGKRTVFFPSPRL
jgi:hypothetical protein